MISGLDTDTGAHKLRARMDNSISRSVKTPVSCLPGVEQLATDATRAHRENATNCNRALVMPGICGMRNPRSRNRGSLNRRQTLKPGLKHLPGPRHETLKFESQVGHNSNHLKPVTPYTKALEPMGDLSPLNPESIKK